MGRVRSFSSSVFERICSREHYVTAAHGGYSGEDNSGKYSTPTQLLDKLEFLIIGPASLSIQHICVGYHRR